MGTSKQRGFSSSDFAKLSVCVNRSYPHKCENTGNWIFESKTCYRGRYCSCSASWGLRSERLFSGGWSLDLQRATRCRPDSPPRARPGAAREVPVSSTARKPSPKGWGGEGARGSGGVRGLRPVCRDDEETTKPAVSENGGMCYCRRC